MTSETQSTPRPGSVNCRPRRPVRRAIGAIVPAAVALLIACGDSGGSTTAATSPSVQAPAATNTEVPATGTSAPATAFVLPATATRPPPTPTAAAAEEVSNRFGLKVAIIRSIAPGDEAKLTLPTDPDQLDLLATYDAIPGSQLLLVGIADGVLLSPVDVSVAKVERIKGSSLDSDIYTLTMLQLNGNRVLLSFPGDSTLAVKEGDSVARHAVIARLSRRMDGAPAKGYSTVVELAGGPLGGIRIYFTPDRWAGGRPSAFLGANR